MGMRISACRKSPATTAHEPPIVAMSSTTNPVTTMVTGRLIPKTDAAKTAKPKSQIAA